MRDSALRDTRSIGARLEAIAKNNSDVRLRAWKTSEKDLLWQIEFIPAQRPVLTLCLASGIHGDEPAGVEALLRFLEAGPPKNLAITAFPCMNPESYRLGLRVDARGRDLNRYFNVEPQPLINALYEKAVCGRHWDLFLDLHEDYQSRGFYLFEPVPLAFSPSSRILAALQEAGYPLEPAETLLAMLEEEGGYPLLGVVEGWARVSRLDLTEKGLPQAPFMVGRHSDDALTFETPSKLPFETRVQMHLTALRAAIDASVRLAAGARR